MDGLIRREVKYSSHRIRRPSTLDAQSQDRMLQAYAVGGRDVLRTWDTSAAVIVLLPDEAGWKSKEVGGRTLE